MVMGSAFENAHTPTTRAHLKLEVALEKETIFTPRAICESSTKTCCGRNCMQPFLLGQIEIMRCQLHVRDGFYEQSKCLLEAHRQIHKDVNGNNCITLKKREVCFKAWWIIYGIS